MILNMHSYIYRTCFKSILYQIKRYPVVALLGPRQSGKSTLAKEVQKQVKKAIYFDLQEPRSLHRLEDPIALFEQYEGHLIILDEIQKKPEFFSILRSLIDKKRQPGRVLILGSASPDLIKQSSETLAGRICYIEITPFQRKEVNNLYDFQNYWLRGGYPLSLLAENNRDSFDWRINYIRTFLERDIPQLGFGYIGASQMQRLWKMLAHSHGQVLNQSKLAQSLGVSSVSIKKYLSLLEHTFIIRQLDPYSFNLKKRLIKSPKVYIRDSGLLHALLEIEDIEDLMSHPVCGSSFESLVIENIIFQFQNWKAFFLRTSNATEVDLLLNKGQKKLLFEIKLSSSPKASRGFYQLVEEIKPQEAFIIAPVKETFKVKGITYSSLELFINDKISKYIE